MDSIVEELVTGSSTATESGETPSQVDNTTNTGTTPQTRVSRVDDLWIKWRKVMMMMMMTMMELCLAYFQLYILNEFKATFFCLPSVKVNQESNREIHRYDWLIGRLTENGGRQKPAPNEVDC